MTNERSNDTPDALNAAQREAVAHDDGPMLVVAGAGSGKTRVLAARIARLVRDRGVAPERILAVTFTNKAAGEMRDRVARAIARDPRGLWVGTFHSIGARLLRRYADRVGRTAGFTIYDADDAESLVRRLLEEAGASPKQWSPKAVAAAISDAKNALVSVAEYRSTARDPFAQTVAKIYEAFDRALVRANAATFDDLLTLPVELLRGHPDVAQRLGSRFAYVLVDEYQDTNVAQYQLIKGLSPHGNVFVVGDDDQAIYGWRGADIRNILEFDRDFPTARVVHLEENYRSRPEVLALANAVIHQNAARRDKTLRPTRPSGEPVALVTTADERDEADFVIEEMVVRRARHGQLAYGDLAVLYRTNAQSRPFEEALQRRGIPYRLIGQVRFYERREIKDMLAWLRVIANPADDEAFRRAVTAPRRGIGDTSMDAVGAAATRLGISMLAAARPEHEIPVRGAARAALAEVTAIIDKLRATARTVTVDVILRDVISATGYDEWLRGEGPDAEDRIANVDALIEAAAEAKDDVEGEGGVPPLDLFLQRVALVTSADESTAENGMVTLMTLHNAKGLEFPVVFVAGVEDGLLPLVRNGQDDDALMEEERRLFYVGITRAKDALYVTRALRRWRNGESMPSARSRFLRGLPTDAVESRETLRAQTAASTPGRWRRDAVDRDDDFAPELPRGDRRRGTPVVWADTEPDVEDESQDAPRFAVGERVRHARFGAGSIVEVIGYGAAAKARIEFDDESIGRKTLMLQQARLERGWED